MFDNLLQGLLMAAAPAAGRPGKGGWWIVIVEFALIFWVFYIFVLKPQNREKKRLQDLREGLKKGERVLTTGGIYGVVHRVNKDKKTVQVTVADKVVIEMAEAAIASTLNTQKEQQKG